MVTRLRPSPPRPSTRPVITLTTDFGTRDNFVGVLKGVLFQGCPEAAVIDLTHDIPPGDVAAGAFALATAASFFPPNTLHLAVVDPGVGSSRHAIAIQTRTAVFMGPDNGVLSWAVQQAAPLTIRRLTNHRLFLPSISCTFHGRDVFAPVAAYLAAGGDFAALGPQVSSFVRLPWPEPRRSAHTILGQVVYVDHFGNAITNIPVSWLEPWLPWARLHLAARRPIPVGRCYAEAAPGQALALPGSSGLLEIAVNRGSAARRLRLAPGIPIRLALRPAASTPRRPRPAS